MMITFSRVRRCVTRLTKKCPSRITTFNGSSVADSVSCISIGGRFIVPRKMTRSLSHLASDASERIVIFESMKITLARIDTEPRWNWHIHLSPGICMACMGKSRGATSRDWPCIIHRISVERSEILNNKSGLERFFGQTPRHHPRWGVRASCISSRYFEPSRWREREWESSSVGIAIYSYETFEQNKDLSLTEILGTCFLRQILKIIISLFCKSSSILRMWNWKKIL